MVSSSRHCADEYVLHHVPEPASPAITFAKSLSARNPTVKCVSCSLNRQWRPTTFDPDLLDLLHVHVLELVDVLQPC